MSSTSERITGAVGHGDAIEPARLRSAAGRWLMFSDYGEKAQRHMAVIWSCVLGCALADVIWLPHSRLSFASSNWLPLLESLVGCVVAGGFIAIASHRLRNDATRPARILRTVLTATELLWRAALPFGALLTVGVTLSYLMTSADLPLQDDFLARLDRSLGFSWLGFLETANSSPFLAELLTRVYQTIGIVVELVFVWLAVTRHGERLAEFLAILGLSTVGLCIGMWLAPAAGGFAYHVPAPQLFDNFSRLGEMWPFARAFSMLRDGSLTVIDLSELQGVVSFPSFHTMLGVMTIYALRGTVSLMIPVLLINGMMIVATMPVGGHHLVDVLAGAGVVFVAALLRR